MKEIDDQLRLLNDEASRLEAARAALTGGRRSVGHLARNGSVRAPRPVRRRTRRPTGAGQRRDGNTRASQALELVREKPGITIPEMAKTMKIEPNYLYRVLPRLASDGQVTRDGQGWHPAPSSTSTPAQSVRRVRRRTPTGGDKATSAASAARATRTPRGAGSTSTTTGRTTAGATKASVLAALAGGEAMTAGQVATKAGLARPTVSTTLSRLAKTGEIQKVERGYRITST